MTLNAADFPDTERGRAIRAHFVCALMGMRGATSSWLAEHYQISPNTLRALKDGLTTPRPATIQALDEFARDSEAKLYRDRDGTVYLKLGQIDAG